MRRIMNAPIEVPSREQRSGKDGSDAPVLHEAPEEIGLRLLKHHRREWFHVR